MKLQQLSFRRRRISVLKKDEQLAGDSFAQFLLLT